MVKRTAIWIIPFLAVGCTTLMIVVFAQAPSGLADVRLNANAHLPQHNPPGIPLSQLLDDARAQASSRGIAWKGLDIIVTDDEALPPNLPLSTALLQVYPKQACQADAIVVGRPRSSLYHLSAFGTSIYGDHVFMIDSLLKDNVESSIRSQAEIVVTRPGGSISLSGGAVNINFRAFPLPQPGVTYLMFLRYIRQTSSYQAIDALSTLVGDGSNWVIARKSFSGLAVPGFTRGSLESTIANWLTPCK